MVGGPYFTRKRVGGRDSRLNVHSETNETCGVGRQCRRAVRFCWRATVRLRAHHVLAATADSHTREAVSPVRRRFVCVRLPVVLQQPTVETFAVSLCCLLAAQTSASTPPKPVGGAAPPRINCCKRHVTVLSESVESHAGETSGQGAGQQGARRGEGRFIQPGGAAVCAAKKRGGVKMQSRASARAAAARRGARGGSTTLADQGHRFSLALAAENGFF
jgi:hypothetical protein